MRGSTPPAPTGYDLLRSIGHGASSVVWVAVQLSTGRRVALKILDADISDPEAQRRFDRERNVMASLAAHPGIVTIHDAGVDEGRPWIAMELCRRGSLASHISSAGPLGVAAALSLLLRLADALSAAHGQGVVHCDVKPANVMITDHGEAALGDFGIARVTVGRATTTTVGGFSLDHVAPELLDEQKSTPRSDVYSLGTTAWELLAGYPPFRRTGDASVLTVIKRIMTEPLPQLPEVPGPVLDLLRDMTTKDPTERIAGMTEVAERARSVARELDLRVDGGLDLPPLSADEPSTDDEVTGADREPDGTETVHRRRPVPDAPTAAVEPRPVQRRRGAMVASLAAALALVLAGGIAVASRGDSPAPPQTRVDVLAQSSPATSGSSATTPFASTENSASSAPADTGQPVADNDSSARSAARAPRTGRQPGGSNAAPKGQVPAPVPARSKGSDVQPAEPEAAVVQAEPEPGAAAQAAPAPAPAPARRSDGSSCFATAIHGGLTLGDNQQHNAGGPNFTSAACSSIHVKLTSAVYRTYARSCLESEAGSSITSCSSWVLLSYPDTWDTLSRGVPAGTRWQIQMYSEGGPERVSFSYTA